MINGGIHIRSKIHFSLHEREDIAAGNFGKIVIRLSSFYDAPNPAIFDFAEVVIVLVLTNYKLQFYVWGDILINLAYLEYPLSVAFLV